MQRVVGGDTPSKTCGGTAHLLPEERKRASFDVRKLQFLLGGDEERVMHMEDMKKMYDPSTHHLFDFTYDIHDERKEAFKKSLIRTTAAHKILKKNPEALQLHMDGATGKRPDGLGIGHQVQSGPSAAGNHFGIFVGALLAQAGDEQKQEWFRRAINLEIWGAYAQTELGHGSNVRALETIAVFDPTTEEFVIDSPTLTSLKWWPGCFGLAATHAIVYARLILQGKDYGVHSFMVQLRDENHKPMPGIEIGDVGPKMGYNLVDNGYCGFSHVRIPRKNLLNRYQDVTKDGQYVKTKKVAATSAANAKASEKLGHITMIATRVGMIWGSYASLARATTISIRYSAVRKQGFKDTRENSMASGENVVLDYQVQQSRLFKWLSIAYAYAFTATVIRNKLVQFTRNLEKGDVSELPELHATAAGLKAFCTNHAGDGIEECRRCCGGHGCLMSSGIAKLLVDYNSINPIAEGDKIVLALQTARFLVRSVQAAQQKAKGGAGGSAETASYLGELEMAPPDLSDPRDLQKLAYAFRWRAHASAYAVTAQFAKELNRGLPFDEAWNRCAVELVRAAEHHCFYFMVSTFVNFLDTVEDKPIRTVLTRLCQHFALVQIRENGADWIPHFSAAQYKGVDATLMQLLREIRPDAVPLVDAFGISDNTLSSALGRHDGNVYEALYDYAKKCPLNHEEYIEEFHREVLMPVIDQDYLRDKKKEQRAGPPPPVELLPPQYRYRAAPDHTRSKL